MFRSTLCSLFLLGLSANSQAAYASDLHTQKQLTVTSSALAVSNTAQALADVQTMLVSETNNKAALLAQAQENLAAQAFNTVRIAQN